MSATRFTQEEGVIHLGGIDALVRLTLDQVRTDARRGLKTGMFVSGYRGSPVGMLDAALIKQQKLLLQNHIHFVDGLNEDLAATAVWGTQMLHTVGKQKFDGVTGLWYGKAPGVDRSGDALKHANYTGIGKNGGVLAIAGDDPSCKSSSLCSQSEPMLFHVGIPSLYPGNVQEILDFGLHGYQMSRLSGLWMGMKIVTNVADGSGSANVSPERLNFITPDLEFDGQLFTPNMNLGMNVRAEALEMEQSLYTRRLEVAKRYARANKPQQRGLREPRRLAGHHHRRQDLQRPAPGLPRDGPGRRGAAPLRHPHPQDGHAVPDGADHRARVRARPGGDLRHRGEAPLPGDVRQEGALRHGQRAAHRRQVRRGREGAAAALRRVRVRRDRAAR
jgi:hypothetical protein